MSFKLWLAEVKQAYFSMFGDILDDSNPVWFDHYCEGTAPLRALEIEAELL